MVHAHPGGAEFGDAVAALDEFVAVGAEPVEVFALHVSLPAGAKSVVAKFLHTSPLQTSEGRITMTREMLNLQWEKMSLYPAGHYVRRIRVVPSVTLPEGFDYSVVEGPRQAEHLGTDVVRGDRLAPHQ